MVHNHDGLYAPDFRAAAERIDDLRLRKVLLEHRAWVAVDWLYEEEEEEDEAKRDEAYRYIGKLIAELADDSCLAIYHPEGGGLVLYDEAIVEMLRGEDPLRAFDSPTHVPVTGVRRDDPRMRAAVAEARRRWPEFVAAFEKRRPDQHFAVKAPFTDGEHTEFMWVGVTSIENDVIYGTLDSEPLDVKTVRTGDRVKVKLGDLNDWLYMDGEELRGGFTVKVLEGGAPSQGRAD